MSSNLSIEVKRLNKGGCISLEFQPLKQCQNRSLELMGILPLGTFCYICGALATHDYNQHRLCNPCLVTLKVSNNNRITQMHGENRYVRYGWSWISEKGNTYPAVESPYNYKTRNPKEMFKIALLGKKKDINNSKCLDCGRFTSTDSYCYKNSYACTYCATKAKIYFDLKLVTYMYLRKIFYEEINIAKLAVLYHHKIKLTNCLHT